MDDYEPPSLDCPTTHVILTLEISFFETFEIEECNVIKIGKDEKIDQQMEFKQEFLCEPWK